MLHLHQWGSVEAPPVLCLHGVSSHGLRFRRLAEERLAEERYVVAPDLRGHGRSDWEPPWNFETHLEDLRDTLDALGIERTDVMGHSFGGRLALELAGSAPERVGRLVLLDPAVWVPPPVAIERAEGTRADESFASVEEAVEARASSELNPLTPRRFLEEEVPEHLEPSDDGRFRYRYSRAAVVAAYGEMARRPRLESVRASVLLVHGADSDVVPPALVDACRELLADVEVVTVPGRHVVMWDAFEETAEAVMEFLGR